MTDAPSPLPAPRPGIGAGAVVWRGEEVLLIRRGKAPRLGQWSIPGGHVEWGETAAEAAVREVLEETGCAVEIACLCDVVDWIDGGHHMILIDFTARWLAGEPAPGDDAAEARFVPFEEIGAFGLWPETERVIALSRAQRNPNG